MTENISKKIWGEAESGEIIYLFRLENDDASYVEITNYGAAIVSVVVPDRHGKLDHVVLGFPKASAYLEDSCYLGSTIGRYANRISKARFELNGNTFQLEPNDGLNVNHGGLTGYNKRIFEVEIKNNALVMSLLSPDGDGGFPGNLELEIVYSWHNDHTLSIQYNAVSDQDTPANFTNHAYFNLTGFGGTILKHKLNLSSVRIAQIDEDYLPTGRIIEADNVKFHHEMIAGVNEYYILDDQLVAENGYAAKLTDEQSGRSLKVMTSYPGLFVYTGDFLNSKQLNHHHNKCEPYGGLCLECQHYPDSINRVEFPTAITGPKKPYHEFITFKFGLT